MSSSVLSAADRTALRNCWKRPSDAARAAAYVEAIAPRIDLWCGLHHSARKGAAIRDTCEAFADRLASLQAFMDQEQESLSAILHGQEHFPESDIRAAAASLRESADTLAQAARATASAVPVSPGCDKGPEIWLVAVLAILYRDVFEKEPSRSPGTNFWAVLDVLRQRLGYEFGPDTIKAGIARRSAFVPPSMGWHVASDENL